MARRTKSRARGRRQGAAAGAPGALEQAFAAAVRDYQQGRLAEAERHLVAIQSQRPGIPDVLHLLALIALQSGRAEDAAAHLREAVAGAPESAELHNLLGAALRRSGRPADAVAAYRRAVALAPDMADAHYNLANALKEEGKREDAIAHYGRAVALNPAFADAHYNLGFLLRQVGRAAEAAAALQQATRLNPRDAEAFVTLGNALADDGRNDEAVAACDQAIALDPDLAEAHFNRGNLMRLAGRNDEAIACYRRAVAAEPAHAAAHHNLGDALLRGGKLEEGWAEHEWRWRIEEMENRRPFPQPEWQGQPLDGKTILVTAEQGVGDEILFAGMVPDLVDRGARVVLECGARLVPLFERSFTGVACVAKDDPPAAETQAAGIDYQTPAGSLGRWLRPDFASFPGRPSYLAADAAKRTRLREKYKAGGGDALVGIAWRSTNPKFGRQKSMALAELAPLTAVPGVTLVDLQYGDTEAERQAFEKAAGTAVIHDDSVDQMASLDDFAAQVAALDLVVSVSNTTVHMAGALGVPTWVMPHVMPLWVWLLGRDDSPWYPSVRLFRQAQAARWSEVIGRVAAALAEFAAGARR